MTAEDQSFQQRMGRIESLIQEIERFNDDHAKSIAHEIVQSLLDLHGTGLTNLLQVVMQSNNSGAKLIEELTHDELITNLLLLYDLHPLDVETRIEQSLDRIRPYLHSHKGNIEFLDISEEGVARVQLTGTCEGCHSASSTIKLAVEEAILSVAPDVVKVEALGVNSPAIVDSLSLPLLGDKPTPGEQAGWVSITESISLDRNEVVSKQVSGIWLILCRTSEHWYAYARRCPSCSQSLENATLTETTLTCDHCSTQYDIQHAGKSLTSDNLHLIPYPLLQTDEGIQVALPAMS